MEASHVWSDLDNYSHVLLAAAASLPVVEREIDNKTWVANTAAVGAPKQDALREVERLTDRRRVLLNVLTGRPIDA